MPKARATAAPVVMDAEDVAALEASAGLLDLVADGIWPGLAGFRAPALFIARSGQFLLGAPAAPDYYVPYRGPGPSWSPRTWFTPERRSYDGRPMDPAQLERAHIHYAYSSEQTGGHFPHPLVFQDSPARARAKLAGQSLERWLGVFWHEVFHVFQETRGLTKGLEPNRVTAEKDPARRRAYARVIAAEQAVLVEALRLEGKERKRALLRERYLPARRRRLERLAREGETELRRCELVYEAAEGTARYVEERACRDLAALPEDRRAGAEAALRALPAYRGFSEFRGAVDDPAALAAIDPDLPHYFSYQTGLALTLLLEELSPGWKDGVFAAPELLLGALERACAR